jgi:hypothetical protein
MIVSGRAGAERRFPSLGLGLHAGSPRSCRRGRWYNNSPRHEQALDDSAFSDEFCRFLQTTVPSVDAAELLLALAADPQRWWLPADLASQLRPSTVLSDTDAVRYLEQFHAGKLTAIGPDGRLQYRPATETLAQHVHMLAQAYKERPVTLFRVIYALRDLKIQSFADAFKLRRK